CRLARGSAPVTAAVAVAATAAAGPDPPRRKFARSPIRLSPGDELPADAQRTLSRTECPTMSENASGAPIVTEQPLPARSGQVPLMVLRPRDRPRCLLTARLPAGD